MHCLVSKVAGLLTDAVVLHHIFPSALTLNHSSRFCTLPVSFVCVLSVATLLTQAVPCDKVKIMQLTFS